MIRLTFKSVLPRVLLAVFVASFLLPIALTKKASAQSGGIEVIDGTRLIYDGKTYNDRDPYDTTYEWTYGPDNCQSKIAIGKASFENKNSNPTASIILQEKGATGDCFESAESKGDKLDSVLLNSASRRFTTAHRLDKENIFFPVGFQDPGCSLGYWVDDEPTTFRRAPAGDSSYRANLYFGIQSGDPPLDGFIRFTTSPGNTGRVSVDISCVNTVTHDKQINYADISDRARVIYGIPGGAVPEAGVGNATLPADDQPSCESEGLDLSWIICPLLSLGDKVVRTLDTEVTRLLEVPNEYLEKKDSEGKIPVEEAWMRIRSIAYIILIPVMLVMIISTALGFEFISAYTLKKSMPRLIAAVLFITLSFEICKFLIILTNDVGMGMNGLITSAFTGSGDVSLANIFSPDGGDSILTGAGLVAAGGAALALGSIGILFSYMFVAVVSMGLAFFLLSFRQMLIIALVLLSPLAVIAWIFPGNDKLWKLWWGTFSKLLLLFPLIMILIAAGKSFAVLVGDVGGDVGEASLVNTLLKLIAYIGPFFLIPATFKFAGGVFATASGMANDRGRGLFDRQKKYRGRKAGENYRDFKAGDKSWRPRAFNNLGERAGVGLGGRFGIGARGQASIQKQRRNNAAERMSKDEELKQLALSSDDGNAVMALSGGTNEGARAAAEDLRESWVAGGLSRSVATDRANSALNDALAVGVNRSRSQAAFSTMMQNKARAISGGEEGRQVFERGLNRLHGESAPNDAALDETRQAARYFARESGRADLGGETVVNGFTRTGAYKAIRGYEPAVVALMTDLTARHNDARTRGDQADMFETSAQITAVRNAMGQDMSEGNKQAVTAMLVGTGIDISSTRSVDQQLGTQINPVDPGGATEMIRDRVGLYDSGELTQAQLVARQNQINNPN